MNILPMGATGSDTRLAGIVKARFCLNAMIVKMSTLLIGVCQLTHGDGQADKNAKFHNIYIYIYANKINQ
jgi:hypothetical protein